MIFVIMMIGVIGEISSMGCHAFVMKLIQSCKVWLAVLEISYAITMKF